MKTKPSSTNRMVLLLDTDSKSTMKKVQQELQVKLTSSAELSSKVSCKEVLETDSGILFKNIGIAVVENVAIQQMEYAAAKHPKILHWEKERVFTTADNIAAQLEKVKQQMGRLQTEVAMLESMLKAAESKSKKNEYPLTWGLEKMGLSGCAYSGKGVDLCVLDTGFYLSHPDFKGRSIIGKTFIPGEPWDYDGHGHGTHCAGTAAGYYSPTKKIRYGIAYESNIFIGKVLSDEGSGTTTGVIDAIDWALEKKCGIISMSLSSIVAKGEKSSPIFEQIGQKALAQNTLLIAAAGNESKRPKDIQPVGSPANTNSIMGIGAVDNDDNIARFSNGSVNPGVGSKINLVAPGVGVFSSYSKNASGKKAYQTLNGTSMATPHISGLAALYKQAYPNLSAKALWAKMEKNALKIKNMMAKDYGKGIGVYS